MIRPTDNYCQPLSALPLFAWASRRKRHPDTHYAAEYLKRRYRLSSLQARLISELAGLGGGA